MRETVYVGLYASGGNIYYPIITLMTSYYCLGDFTIPGGVTLSQKTFTCISTGGPVTEGTETVLDDPVIAQYTHTLTVTGRLTGFYTCTVANDKPSSDSAQYLLGLNTYYNHLLHIFRYS